MNQFLVVFRQLTKGLMNYTMKNRWLVLVIDVLLCMGCLIMSVFLHNRYQLHDISLVNGIIVGLWYLFFLIVVFVTFQYYRGLTRHLQFYEIGKLALTMMLPNLGVFLVVMVLMKDMRFPGLFALILYLQNLLLLLLMRSAIVFINNYSTTYSGKIAKRTYVYGIGAHSVSLSQWLARSSSYNVAGFVFRDEEIKNMVIQGKHVFNLWRPTITEKWFNEEPDVLLFPDYKSARKEQELLGRCIQKGILVLVSPPLEGLNENNGIMYKMKPIKFEDLLGREEIEINMELIREQLGDSTVLITGAAGSIGSELARQLAVFRPAKLVLLDVAETPLYELGLELAEAFPDLNYSLVIGDVRRCQRLDFVFRTFKPKVVYHAAAYKHVPLMENNPCEAVLDNVMGTRLLADMSVAHGVKRFVMISTDKAVNPTNVMGASKRIAEMYVQSLARDCSRKGMNIHFVTTRFGNVLGSNGSVIPHFKNQIEKGGPVTVTHPNIIRYFMTIPEACRLVLEAASFGNSGEIYVFDMGLPVKIVNLAQRMIEMAGLVPDKDIKIEYIGLRPGEKLFEELLNKKEETLPTKHDKILVAKVREYDFDKVTEAINEMIAFATDMDVERTVLAMKLLVPEFKSKNSPFEAFDKETTAVSAVSAVRQ